MTARADRGSALMLLPAGVLIVLLLGSISLDFSLVYLRQRQALNLAADAANDAATRAIDTEVFRTTGEVVFDPARFDDLEAHYEARGDFGDRVTVTIAEHAERPGAVRVEVTVDYRLVFAGALPGADRDRTVTVEATALPEAEPPL